MSGERRMGIVFGVLAAANVAVALVATPWAFAIAGLLGVRALEEASPRARRFLQRPVFSRRRR